MIKCFLVNRSEQFVHDLATKAFLSLWTYPNPTGKDGSKELCDVLVVCRPDIVIFSVKEIELQIGGDAETAVNRWKRRAVDDSIRQIYGAERRVKTTDRVAASDGTRGVDLGPLDLRRIHRVAVAIGARGSVPLESSDHGKGFVHVFDERTLFLLLNELDTITDFVEYLAARESLLSAKPRLLGTEADLLASFFAGQHSFAKLLEEDFHLRVIVGSWDNLVNLPQFEAKKKADQSSYVWDWLISKVHEDFISNEMEFGGDLDSVDQVTRIMAREPRLQRRVLGQGFHSFMEDATKKSRLAFGDSAVGYVFFKQKHAEPREKRVGELHARCLVARDFMDQRGIRGDTVVGIATEFPEEGSGFSLDVMLFNAPEWGHEQRAFAAETRNKLDILAKPVIQHYSGDEFPSE